MLEECRESVRAQTTDISYEHRVEIDSKRMGCAKTMNYLAREANGVYLVLLADDDLLLPGALRVLTSYLDADTDIVYSPPLVWGNDSKHFFGEPPCIPSFALMRAQLYRDLGGYDEESIREEDRGLWTRALAAGATFVRADREPTWVYRFHGGNKSYHGGIAS